MRASRWLASEVSKEETLLHELGSVTEFHFSFSLLLIVLICKALRSMFEAVPRVRARYARKETRKGSTKETKSSWRVVLK